jgi:hypothetical protein
VPCGELDLHVRSPLEEEPPIRWTEAGLPGYQST